MAKASWYCIFEEDPGPENVMMKEFAKDWPNLDTSPEAEVFTLSEDLPGKQEAVEFYKKILTVGNRNSLLPRDDYR